MEDKIRVLVPEKDVDAKIAELGKKISEEPPAHLVYTLPAHRFLMSPLCKP